MQHVVADLHVLEDLRHRQGRGAGQPKRAPAGPEQEGARGEHQLPVQANHAADVAGVGLAEGREHIVVDGVELAPELLELLGGEARQRAAGLARVQRDGLRTRRLGRALAPRAGLGGGR